MYRVKVNGEFGWICKSAREANEMAGWFSGRSLGAVATVENTQSGKITRIYTSFPSSNGERAISFGQK